MLDGHTIEHLRRLADVIVRALVLLGAAEHRPHLPALAVASDTSESGPSVLIEVARIHCVGWVSRVALKNEGIGCRSRGNTLHELLALVLLHWSEVFLYGRVQVKFWATVLPAESGFCDWGGFAFL